MYDASAPASIIVPLLPSPSTEPCTELLSGFAHEPFRRAINHALSHGRIGAWSAAGDVF